MSRAEYESLAAALVRFRRRSALGVLIRRLAQWVLALVAALWVFTGLEAVLWLPTTWRQGIVAAVLAGAGGVLVWAASAAVRAWRRPKSAAELAYEVGGRLPGIGDRLGNAVAVYEQSMYDSSSSSELASLSLRRAWREVAGIDFVSIVDLRPTWRWVRFSSAGLVGSLLLIWALPASVSQAWIRLIHPGTVFPRGPVIAFRVEPGNAEVLRSAPVELVCWISGAWPREVSLFIEERGSDRRLRLVATPDSSGSYRHRLAKVERDFDYWFSAEAAESQHFRIVAVDPPVLRELQLELLFPAYTGLAPQSLEPNVGDVAALVGTRVLLRGEASKPISAAKAVFRNGDTLWIRASGEKLRGEFVVREDTEYRIELRDQKGYPSPEGILYRVTAFRDAPPVVSIPVPGTDATLDESMSLPLVVMAEDDFGVQSLELRYRVLVKTEWPGQVDTSWKSLPLPVPRGRHDRLTVEYDWSLKELDLLPEDEVEYFAWVRDNDRITGPKEGRSPIYRVRCPSVYELYEEVRREQEGAFSDLTDVREQTRELQDRVRELAREMLRDTRMDWERRQQLSELVSEHQQLLQALRTAEQKLDSAIQQLDKNQLVAMETLEKYRQIQELVRQIDSPQFRQALQRLQEALDRLDPNRVQEALQKLQASQEDLLRSLDRTIELLKRVRLEQELEELRAKVQDLLQRQQTVDRALADPSQKPEQLAGQEKSLLQDAEDLEKQIRELAVQAEELLQQVPRGLDSARQAADSTSVSRWMRQAAESLERRDAKRASEANHQAMKSLFRLSRNLSSAQNELSGRQAEETAQALQRLAWQALELSRAQEELWEGMRRSGSSPEMLTRLAEQQADLRQALDRVAAQLLELGQKSFGVTPEMGQALGQAAEQMNQSLQHLENGNPGPAEKAAFLAMHALNKLSLGTQRALQQAMGAQGQSALEQWLQQLMGISNQQEWLNQQTLQLGLGETWTPEQQAMLEQLAAQQEALRQLLEQALSQLSGQVGSAGRLDRVAEEMKEVADELRQGSIRQETVEKQQRILSRLLDAQRSVRREGYSRQRKAETAKEQLASHPEALPPDLGEAKASWRRDLLRALKEGYTRDFRRMIEAYFEAMAKKEAEKSR